MGACRRNHLRWKGTAAEKMTAMKKAGILVVESPAEIGITMLKAIEKIHSKKRTIANKKTKTGYKKSKILKLKPTPSKKKRK